MDKILRGHNCLKLPECLALHCTLFRRLSKVRQIGCKIKFIAGDGNCLFRSLADQLEGRQQDHASVRAKVRPSTKPQSSVHVTEVCAIVILLY